jgi:hypothetical protein
MNMPQKRDYDYALIAKVTGLSLRSVYKAKKRQEFDLDDFMSVCKFVVSKWLVKKND